MREIGVVKWFNTEKGYGFISRIGDFEDLFVHITELLSAKSLIFEGEFVTYEVSEKLNRRQATKVKHLKEEDDLDILKQALLSDRNGIWQYGFKKYVPTLNDFDEKIIKIIESKLNSAPVNSELINYVPDNLLYYSEILLSFASPRKKIQIFLDKIKSSIIEEEKRIYIKELATILRQNKTKEDWELIPNELLINGNIFRYAPNDIKFTYYTNNLENNKVKLLKDYIHFLKQNYEFIERIPESLIKKYNELFILLPAFKQVEIIWAEIGSKWSILSDSAKLLAIYKSAKENHKTEVILSKLKGNEEKNVLIKAFLLIMSTKYYKGGYKFDPFQKAHEMIQEYFIHSINSTTEEILNVILPNCYPNETFFCEGRIWPSINNDEKRKDNDTGSEIAFCPRKAGPCVVGELGARLYSNTNMHWKYWTLSELLAECGLETNLVELQKNDLYVMKLSGWVNRLLEIKERMNCLVCGEKMIPNYKYAKNLAKYNVTVTKCKHGHGSQVYLTHCWACHKIIDSRESPFQVEGFYICIHCGSGPQKGTYKQGDFCPKCFSPDMESVHNKINQCTYCYHRIKLPLDQYLTGID